MADLEAMAAALHSDALHLMRGVRRADQALGLGPARLSALSVLLSGPKTLGELAAAEQVKPPTITRVVAGLEGLGLARRTPHPTDRRSALVEMTPAGRALIEQGRAARVTRLVEALKALGGPDQTSIEAALPALQRVSELAVRGA